MEGGEVKNEEEESKVNPAEMEGNNAEEQTPKPDDDDEDDDMQLEDAPKSEIPEPIDDKSDPGMLAKLKKEEDE
jgi:hypothetical protein